MYFYITHAEMYITYLVVLELSVHHVFRLHELKKESVFTLCVVPSELPLYNKYMVFPYSLCIERAADIFILDIVQSVNQPK